jgi:hypothetical protein
MVESQKSKRHPVRALLLLTQPTVIVLAAILFMVHWRIPTMIRLDLVVTFSESPSEHIPFPKSDTISSFTIQRGEISYPDFPDKKMVVLSTPAQIELKPLERFQIQEISRDSETQQVRFQISGIAERVQVTVNGVIQDYRLTQFERFKHSQTAFFGGIAAWIFFTAIGWYKVYQELKA